MMKWCIKCHEIITTIKVINYPQNIPREPQPWNDCRNLKCLERSVCSLIFEKDTSPLSLFSFLTAPL